MIPHSGLSNSGPLRSTANYAWSTADVLGQGATGYVFKGIGKKDNKEYAIKVFNYVNFMARPADVRKREFDVLRKVDHQNIVRLYDVEEELSNKHDVIIMELCSAGSLFTMLDDPENLYGLGEDELILVLSHITAGMKHLHDREIVHRDLKPGNIMRSYAEDGTPVYKLTDFGAARELGDNEQFQSLYGTEEYLHPDIYERAVLKKPQGKKFSATVDLWSLGVTLYHVATGQLPFRPFGGVRRNRETMHRITTEKPTGVISGVQHRERGNIEWSRDLPKTCRLSQGFKQLFIPILSGILECDPHKIWTFDRYFAEVDEVRRKHLIFVFTVPTAMLQRLYISPEKTLVSLQEHIAELTDIRSTRQLLLFEGTQFEIESFKPVKEYPKTSPDCPLVLLNDDISDFQTIYIPHTCKPPKIKPSLSLENDASLSKVCSSTLFDIGKSVRYLLLVQELIRLAVKWFMSYLKERIIKIELLCSELQVRVGCLRTSLEIFEEHYQRETSLLRVISMVVATPSEVNELKMYFTQITEKTKLLREIRTKYEKISEQIRTLKQIVIQDKTPASVFVDEGSHPDDRLCEVMKARADRSRETYRLFKKQKHSKRLSVAEDQVHKFEKQKLSEICDSSVKLFTENSVPACKRLYRSSTVWFSNMSGYMKEIQQCESGMSRLRDECGEQEESVRSLQRTYRDKLSIVEAALKDSSRNPRRASSLPEPRTNGLENSISNISLLLPNQVAINQDRQKQFRELKAGLAEATNSLKEVKSEVATGSEILRMLGSFNMSNSQ